MTQRWNQILFVCGSLLLSACGGHEESPSPAPATAAATAEQAAAPSAPAAPAAPARVVHCDLREQPMHLCIEDRLSADQTDALARTACASSQLGVAHPAQLADGACPTENRGSSCDDGFGQVKYYYGPQERSFFENMRAICSGTYTIN